MLGYRTARLLRLVLVFYFLEAGTFLVLSPWSRLWLERVVSRSPLSLQPGLNSPYFRGFIAGLGLLHILFALRELNLWRADLARRASQP